MRTSNLCACAVTMALCAAALQTPAVASSHREAPNITRLSTLDSTDFCLFRSYELGRDG